MHLCSMLYTSPQRIFDVMERKLGAAGKEGKEENTRKHAAVNEEIYAVKEAGTVGEEGVGDRREKEE